MSSSHRISLEMKSYRFTSVLIAAFRTSPFRTSSVICVGGSSLIFGASSSCWPDYSRSDSQSSSDRSASSLADQIGRTSRVAPTGHKLFNFFSSFLQSRRWAHFGRSPEMKSYRFTSVLIAAFRTSPLRVSSVICVGGSSLSFGASSSCLPDYSRSDSQSFSDRSASNLADQIRRTSRVAPTGHKLFNCISTSLQSRRWAHF